MGRGLKLVVAYLLYLCLTAVIFLGISEGTELPVTAISFVQATLFQHQNKILRADESGTINGSGQSTGLQQDKKYLILTFDDGWKSQYEAYQSLKPYRGTLYICSALIGEKDRLSLANLKEMYDNGWDICNHTAHHANLTKVSLQKAYAEIYSCSRWIAAQGFGRDMCYMHFAYPEGAYNEQVMGIIKRQKILTARTANPGNSTVNVLELGRASLYGMSRENIGRLIESDSQLIILNLHRIVPDTTSEPKEIDLKESYFAELIEAVKDSKREVITMTQWYRMQ